MSEPIISVSGLRGILGESLDPQLVIRYACAFAAGLPAGPIVMSRDGRATGPMLADAIRAGLIAVGRDVLDAGAAATPTTGVLVVEHQAAGGIQISASHNPAEYNGIKLFSAAGRVITAEQGQSVMDRYRAGTIAWIAHEKLGTASAVEDTTSRHLELVCGIVNVERIAKRAFRVLLDSNGGAGSVLGRRLLETLGCEVTVLGGEPNGQFEHTPEPTAENLAGVLRRVTEVGADVGFCQDPDADRLAVIDAAGRYLGEEYTLAMCVDHLLRQRVGPVVTNCSTSRMSQDLAEKYGAKFSHSAVGEANVTAMMDEQDALLGGEGNGGIIDPRVVHVRDSFVGMALLLDAMASRDLSVGALADELPRYEIVKTKIQLAPQKVAPALETLAQHFSDAQSNDRDGLRLDWPGKWLLVRASNTEPIVRAIAEASTEAEAASLCAEAAEVLGRVK